MEKFKKIIHGIREGFIFFIFKLEFGLYNLKKRIIEYRNKKISQFLINKHTISRNFIKKIKSEINYRYNCLYVKIQLWRKLRKEIKRVGKKEACLCLMCCLDDKE